MSNKDIKTKNATLLKLALILCLSVFSTAIYAQAAKQDPIDVAYKTCLATDTSSANIDACAFVAYGKWDKEMESAYKKLLRVLKKETDKTALKQSQTAWAAYRDASFKSYDNMFNRPGCKWCLLRHDDRIEVVRARTLQLRNYIEALKKK